MIDNLIHSKKIQTLLDSSSIGTVAKQLISRSSLNFAIQLCGVVAIFCLNLLLVRLLGIEEFGIYTYIQVWLVLLATLASLGFSTALLRFVSAYNINEEWGKLRGLLIRSDQIVLAASIVTGLLWLMVYQVFFPAQLNDNWAAFIYGCCALPLFALMGLRQSTLLAFHNVLHANMPVAILRPLILGSLVLGTYFFAREVDASRAMSLFALTILLCFCIQQYWLHRALPTHTRASAPEYATQKWISVALPMLFITGMHIILSRTDIIMIGFYLDTTQAGIYSIAVQCSLLISIGLTSINAVFAPICSELYSQNRLADLQRNLTFASLGIFLFTLISALILALNVEFVLSLFGREVMQADTSLKILLVGQVINALAGPVGYLLNMTGNHNATAFILFLSAVVNIVLNAFLIPIWGIRGAAAATAITNAFWNIAMVLYVRRKLNFDPTILSIRAFVKPQLGALT